jgi:hypothetical protein
MRAAAVLGVLLGCSSAPPAAVTETPDLGRELFGCFRVDAHAGDGIRTTGQVNAPPRELEHGTVYCLELDRYHVRYGGSGWNSVRTRWSPEAVWRADGSRAGSIWTTSPAVRLRRADGLHDLCKIDPDGCMTPPRPEPHACPLVFRRDGAEYSIESGGTAPLVPLDDAATKKALEEIDALEPLDGMCTRASDRLVGARRNLATDDSCEDCAEPEAAVLPDLGADRLVDRWSCEVLLEVLSSSTLDANVIRCPGAERAACPTGTTWTGARCELPPASVACPTGSRREGERCVALEVGCPEGTELVEGMCVAPPPPVPDMPSPRGTATLSLNAIPPARVVVDGRPVGMTPIAGVLVTPGVHVVLFIHADRGRKVVTVRVREGEKKQVAVKL